VLDKCRQFDVPEFEVGDGREPQLAPPGHLDSEDDSARLVAVEVAEFNENAIVHTGARKFIEHRDGGNLVTWLDI